MRYKHKDEIIMNIKDYNAGRKVTGGTHAFESKLEEIHNVYAQAPKADEYEAKAKAFDEGLEAVHDRLQHILHNTDTGKLLPGYVDGMYNALDIINECYESGVSDE